MKVLSLLFLWLTLTLTKATTFYKSLSKASCPLSGNHYEHVIKVNQSSRGAKECTDLSDTLTDAFLNNRLNSSLEIQLDEGCFNLTSPELATFSGWTDIAIVGKITKSGISTTITCSEGVGLSFLSSVGITLCNVKICKCAGMQTSTSKNFTATNSAALSFLKVWVGVHFLSCGDVTMDHVEVCNSEGMGVVMYNCNGTNAFNYTNFIENTGDNDELYRSGGLAVEFGFCQPGDTDCEDDKTSSVQVTQSKYIFYRCNFSYNNYQLGDYHGRIVSYPHGTEHMSFGKGGGLSIVFKGRSSENSISIDYCTFRSNKAVWGGGLYTSFGDQSVDNKITVTRSLFYLNVNKCRGTSPHWIQSGGGAQIDFIYYPADDELWPGYQPNVVRNSVIFTNTNFSSNSACWGGAVSILVSRESSGSQVTNSVSFESCLFEYNLGSIAAAVDVSLFQPDLVTSNGALMAPVFKNCHFVENNITFSDATNYQATMGAVYANLVPLNFAGVTNFTFNSKTALVVSGTHISVAESSKMIFERNSGRHGGAVSFIGNSQLVAHKDVHITFQNNSAERGGGAVYSIHYDEHDLMYKPSCFFQYYKPTLHPSEWNVTYRFSGNLANGMPNSIYATSLLPCIWYNTTVATSDLKYTFCNHPWVFDNDNLCQSEVSTGPSNINRQNKIRISAVPGWRTSFSATTYDDFEAQVPGVYTAIPYNSVGSIEVDKSTAYIADNNIVVQGVANQSPELLLQTLDPKVISSLMIVDIRKCPYSYKQQNCTNPGQEHMACDCKCSNHLPGVSCSNDSHTITVSFGSCLTYQYNGTDIDRTKPAVVGTCPYLSEDSVFHFDVSYDPVELNQKVCGQRDMNRTGTLCSQCMDGLGVDVNDYKFPCVKCHAHYSWFLYILAELIPVAVFFVIMASFNISATSGPMNAFVFFSQIVTIPYFHNPFAFMFGYFVYPYSNVLEAFVSFPYAIWNLDFFVTAAIPGFCLHEGLGTLDVIALKYLNAFLPLLLIIICYVLIKLYDHNFRVVRFLLHPFSKFSKRIYKNRERKTSIIDVIATFMLLSYNKILYVSFSLFAFTEILDANSGTLIGDGQLAFYFDASIPMFHGVYLVFSITAIIIFTLFVVLPPLFFILYPLRCSQKLIDKLPFRIALRTFAEAFNGDFRDGTFKDGSRGDADCRRYAGYYFILRVIVFVIFIARLQWLDQYFIQQLLCIICIVLFATSRPYKEDFYNKLDTAMFTLLALLNAFSLYNNQLYKYSNHINDAVFWINYVLIFLPLVYIISYAVYLILRWKRCLKRWIEPDPTQPNGIVPARESISIVADNEDVRNSRQLEEGIPDRMLNPQNYNSRNLYRPPNESGAKSSRKFGRSNWMQGSSEKSYFRGRRDRMLVPYGSLSESVFPAECHSEPIVRPDQAEHNDRDKRDSAHKR